MDATVTNNPAADRWEVAVDGQVVGVAAYELGPGSVTMTHTVVEPGHEGQGLAGALVRAALDDARERGLAVVPACPYVRSWLAGHPDFLDLVPEQTRKTYGL